jgi:sulfite exporter TauE/SafE
VTDPVTLGAALLLGLVASGHCVLMCGGITAALGVATAKQANGRPVAALLAGYQIGRIASYSLAGLAFGGALGTAIDWLDIDAVRRALRMLAALALLAGALVALGILRDPGRSIGRRLWPKLAPLGRRLLPVTTLPRALGFGMVWGWMPCGTGDVRDSSWRAALCRFRRAAHRPARRGRRIARCGRPHLRGPVARNVRAGDRALAAV